MKRLPAIMKIRFSNRERNFSLWLPLFIILPIVLVVLIVLFLILLPFLLVAAIVFWRLALWRPVLLFWPAMISFLGAVKGLEVDVNHKDEKIFFLVK